MLQMRDPRAEADDLMNVDVMGPEGLHTVKDRTGTYHVQTKFRIIDRRNAVADMTVAEMESVLLDSMNCCHEGFILPMVFLIIGQGKMREDALAVKAGELHDPFDRLDAFGSVRKADPVKARIVLDMDLRTLPHLLSETV